MKSNAAINRRAKLVEEAQAAAGVRVIEAAQAWEADRYPRPFEQSLRDPPATCSPLSVT